MRHDDLDELRGKGIAVPAVFTRGSWLMRPLGTPGLGPSQTQLLLWLPVQDWAAVDAVIGPRGGSGSRTVPVEAAALFDGAPPLARDTIRGVEYATGAFGNSFWKHGWAIATPDGLLVSLVNG